MTESARSRPGTPAGVASRQPGRPAIRRVDVQPEALALGDVGQLADPSTEPVFVEPATAQIASGRRPAARSAAIASATGPPRSRNRRRPATTWSVSAGNPSSSSARPIEKWVWSEA